MLNLIKGIIQERLMNILDITSDVDLVKRRNAEYDLFKESIYKTAH
jgi:hypothetical protein